MVNMSWFVKNADSLRYERKFVITEFDRYAVEEVIKWHPACFSEIFHERRVNSIYLDSENMHSYFESELGISERFKIRIRWYNELFKLIEKPMLELKIKQGHLGGKMIYQLAPFRFDSGFSRNIIRDISLRSDIHAILKEELLLMQPTLLTSYLRKYFQSADKKYRLSLDWDVRYYILSNTYNTFKKNNLDLFNVILELKYARNYDDTAHTIMDYLPFRFSRNSKYTAGLDNLSYFS